MSVARHYRGIVNGIGSRESIIERQMSKLIGVKNQIIM